MQKHSTALRFISKTQYDKTYFNIVSLKMKQTFKLFLFSLFACVVAQGALAQVTTSSLRGHVADSQESLMAASITAIHEPSGTRYNALSDVNGNFFINNMRIGGPYTVKVSFIGYKDHLSTDIRLVLGETYVLNVKMVEDVAQLGEVVVTASSNNPVFNSQRTGAMTAISSREISSLPSITRSITDFTRLTPQANGASFGGRDGRLNNITIDGGQFKNNFGLSNNLMPGGSAQPISLDAIEAVSVNLAPFDVRLSSFTGASINAVTKSGTNTFSGSAYTYQRGKGMNGTKVGDKTLDHLNANREQTYGFSLGGPIIKDKLFFFVNGEFEKLGKPYTGFMPSVDGVAKKDENLSRAKISDMAMMKKFLLDKYGYDPGDYESFPNLDEQNYKFLAKIDWNINDDHKLSLRYNYLRNSSWNTTSSNSSPAGVRRLNPGRISQDGIAFSNSWYGNKNEIHGFAGELNSRFGNNMTNKLMITYTGAKDPQRTSPSALFPHVDILKDDRHYMTFGYELFSYKNQVINNTFSISDDFTYYLGNHTLTAGLRYDNIYVNNRYIREGTSYYRYSSMEDFMENRKPAAFGVTYGYNGKDPEGVQMSFGLAALYLQDEWNISQQFKLTPGIRFELPMYHNKLMNNPQVDRLPEMRYGIKLDISSWPNPQLMVNPRIGFNWDVMGDRSIQVRGGTGLFTGLLPFVWFTNQPTNSGTLQSPEIGLNGNKLPNDFRFEPNFRDQQKKYPDLFPNELKTDGNFGGSIAQVAKDFKMPQIWRSNIAVDFALPGKTTLTLEALYSKDVHAILQRNVNLPEASGTMPDGRPKYASRGTVNGVSSAVVLMNSDKGYQGSFTAQVRNNAIKGLDLMLAYTYTMAKDQSNNPGSAAYSAWVNNHTYGDINDPELSYSQFAVPHRLVGSINYRISYLDHMATSIGIFYSGSHQGRFSYIYPKDINGDGVGGDLLYIPTGVDDRKLTFSDMKDKNGNVVATAADQYKAFMDFVDGNSYLKTRKGNFAERFGGLEPWLNRFDLKIQQDFYHNFGTDRNYTLQLSLDFINFGNLLDSSWGTRKVSALDTNYGNIFPLFMQKDGTVVLNKVDNVEQFNEKANKWDNVLGISSTWGMLFGLRLLF